MTLFEIVDDMRQLYDMATDPETDPEVFNNTLEAIKGALEVKAAGYVNVIKQLEMEQKQAKEISKAFADKAKTRENNIKRMKDMLLMALDTANETEMDAGDFTIKVQKNGGAQPLVITGDIPENMTRVIIEPDNDKIRDFLKNNECNWAHLEERGKHIVIK